MYPFGYQIAVKKKNTTRSGAAKTIARRHEEVSRRSPGDRGLVAVFVRERRRQLGYTQLQLAERTGTGLRFVRELERGKRSLRMDKVNQVLAYFGAELSPASVSGEKLRPGGST